MPDDEPRQPVPGPSPFRINDPAAQEEIDLVDQPAPQPSTDEMVAEDAFRRFVARLIRTRVVSRATAGQFEVQGATTLLEVAKIAAAAGASPESLMAAAQGIPGASDAVSAVFASTRRSSTTVNSDSVIRLGEAQVEGAVFSMFGQGIVRLRISRQEARNLGILTEAGALTEISYSPDGTTFSAPMQLRVFFSDDTDAAVTRALEEAGMGHVASDEEEFMSLLEGLGEDGDFYGGPRQAVRRPVPTWVDPSGFVEVPPVFKVTGGDGPTGNDAWDYVDGWSLEAIAGLQDRMQASRLGVNLPADGVWDERWAAEFSKVLARSNEMGMVLPVTTYGGVSAQQAGRHRQLERLEGMTRGSMGSVTADDQRALGIQATLDEFAARPLPQLEEPGIPPLRVRQSPEDIHAMLQAAARSVAGRELDDYQLQRFTTFLNDRIRLVEQQEDFVARRDFYAGQIEQAGGTLQNPGFEMTPAQRRALETREITLVKDPAKALEDYFKQVFAADLAAQARRAEFAGAGDRMRQSNRSVLSTIATVRRAGG